MNYENQSQRAIQGFKDFLDTPLETVLQQHLDKNPAAEIIKLFQDVATNVPAYQAFLKEQQINPDTIQSFDDFQKLPPLTKDNYLKCYPLADFCRDGKIASCDTIAASSGSTGKPTFWLRFFTDELQIATRFEQIFYDSFSADTKSTLAVVCFALGTWVGGMFTTNCCRYLSSKGYPVTVISPGTNKAEILRVVSELSPNFEQTVLLGYPPFLKDVIDTGIANSIEWQQYNIKFVMAGEVFSEEWRNLVGERVGSQNPCDDFASLYGTADAGVLGNETPLSICIRQFLAKNPETARNLFGESRLPTLVQYDPMNRFFEVIPNSTDSNSVNLNKGISRGTLLFSGDNGIPLVRYNILDNGGIITYDAMLEFLAEHGFSPIKALSNQRGIRNLPFVFVFGRSNFTISYFGANIYPENIKVGLEQPLISDWVTGKFVMQIQEDADKNSFLSVIVELAPQVEASEEKKQTVADSILTQLKRLNSEFANYVPSEYQTPRVELLPMGESEYFPQGVKHRYTRK
ncbi:phenylacetate--CoA ligase family protein [Plectonema cf. radiosum LEGE 06105]|uniref:Phenylacetate--CoA ligase family protein n=1 Tax=Plectonema cf. radiosum LEGE 06105 TaxID=945769 RepID=A0A8J7F3X0_9CYAN|nr:phenylacetate--CoA ligase family protein [Plectonema radiosum]MBE9213588.1 phenylacetate--CoA ligase family protein [Plectonema cf. radiosum LEGE 06105]